MFWSFVADVAGAIGLSVAQAQGGVLNEPTAVSILETARGESAFRANCQICHGPDLGGTQFAPALRGDPFKSKWAGPGNRLFAAIRTMPPAAPDSLRSEDYSALNAYLLQANGLAVISQEPAVEGARATTAKPPTAVNNQGKREDASSPNINMDSTYKNAVLLKERQLAALKPVTDETLANPSDGDWLMWRRTYSSLGFSPLDSINAANVSHLREAWSWSLHPSANEITPLVHDGILFIHSGDAIQALNAASGDLLWEYVRALPESLKSGRAARSKGMAIYGSTIYAPMVDGHIVALDARTGSVIWDHEILTSADLAQGVLLNGVPIVVNGKVIMGVTFSFWLKGGCFVFALDTGTGREAWRFHSIARPGELGGDSWNNTPLDERFGGSFWTGGSFDPQLNQVYFGTGNTYDTATLLKPPGKLGKSSAGLFTESTIALNPDSGKLVWHFQHMSRDLWDLDWSFEQSLIDLPIGGATHKLLVTGGKMALFDAVNRADGRYEFTRDAGLQKIVIKVDSKTGEKTVDPELAPLAGKTKLICPGPTGFRNWQATSYNPSTHILYIPMLEVCADFTWVPRDAVQTAAGGIDQRFHVRGIPGSDEKYGRIQAMDLLNNKTLWNVRQRAPFSSAVLATAGNIAFVGSRDRYFRAYDQNSGEVLWTTRLGNAPSAFPITYAVNGVQYVAVVAGGGNPQDNGHALLTPENVNPSSGTVLWVFKLPEQNDSTKTIAVSQPTVGQQAH